MNPAHAPGREGTTVWQPERRPLGRADFLAFVAWTAAVVIAFGKAALLQEALFYFDVTEINFPYRDFLAGEYRAGRLSRWMPGLHCGLPLFSESQAGFFHPLKLLYLVLPTWQAFNLDTVLSVWLAGAGTYGWLRRHVGPIGALSGAATFALGGFMWSHVIHTSMVNALPSVPLAVWALECAWAGGRLRPVALGAAAVACQVFAGHLQDTILTSLVLGLYGVYRAVIERGARRRFAAAGAAVAMVLLAGLLSAVQWVPSKELLDRSPRAGGLTWDDLTYGSFSPELIPTLVVREAFGTRSHDTDWVDGFYPYQEMNVYLGLLGLGLAALGAAAHRDRWVAFWLLLTLVGGVLMLGRYTFLFDLMHRLPVVGSARIPVRYHLWVSLGVAALVAVGVDRLARPGRVRVGAAVAMIAVLVVVSCPILYRAYAPIWTQPERWTTAYHQARYGWLGRQWLVAAGRTGLLALMGLGVAGRAARIVDARSRAGLAAALPLILLADLLGAHWNEVPTIDPSYWTNPPPTATYLLEQPGRERIYGLGALSAGEPGYAVKPVELMAARDTLAWSLAPVWGLRSSGSITPIFDRRMNLYEMASLRGGTRFDLESVTQLLAGDLGDFARFGRPSLIGRAYVYRNQTALPRARIVGRPEYVAGRIEAAQALLRLGREARTHLIVEDPDRPLSATAAPQGTARVVDEEPERVEVEAVCDGPAYLVLADTFDPGWRVTLDAGPAVIRPAYAGFRAVFLPKGGPHRLVFTYRPAGWTTGLALTALGGAVGVFCLVRRRRSQELAPEHGPSPWPPRWPLVALWTIVGIVGLSVVAVGPEGRPTIQERWSGAFHRFTWGAKIEALRPPATPEFLPGSSARPASPRGPRGP